MATMAQRAVAATVGTVRHCTRRLPHGPRDTAARAFSVRAFGSDRVGSLRDGATGSRRGDVAALELHRLPHRRRPTAMLRTSPWRSVRAHTTRTDQRHAGLHGTHTPSQEDAHTQSQCRGCGVLLQSDRPDELGFVPPDLLAHASRNAKHSVDGEASWPRGGHARAKDGRWQVMCERCWVIKRYAGVVPLRVEHSSFKANLQALRRRHDVVVVAVLDITNFEGSVIPELEELVGEDKQIIVLVNKVRSSISCSPAPLDTPHAILCEMT